MLFENLLVNLPTIISIWTGVTLSWGLFLAVAVKQMMTFADKHKGGHREEDSLCLKCVWCANILLFLYMFISPQITLSFSDAILVINTFINVSYVSWTLDVARWWSSKGEHKNSTQGILT